MKVSTPIKFEFRGGIELPKGESDFPYDKLTPEGQEFFDGLVKAEIVTVLPDEPLAKVAAPPGGELSPPGGDSATTGTNDAAETKKAAKRG